MQKVIQKPTKYQVKKHVVTVSYYTLLTLGALAMLLPFIYMIVTSFTPEGAITSGFKLFPSKVTGQNYPKALEVQPILRQMGNTFLLAFLKLFGEVFISAMVAFGFARFQFRGKNVLFFILLSTMMLPYEVTLMPTFIFWSKLNLTDSYFPLVFPAYFGSATFIFFLKMYFETFPKDYEESAIIDGAGYFQIFVRIFIPLAKPALITIALWSFMGTWNDLLGQLIYITSTNKYTIQLGLASFKNFQGETLTGALMAASAIALLPIIILLLFAQRYFVDGVKMSGIKG